MTLVNPPPTQWLSWKWEIFVLLLTLLFGLLGFSFIDHTVSLLLLGATIVAVFLVVIFGHRRSLSQRIFRGLIAFTVVPSWIAGHLGLISATEKQFEPFVAEIEAHCKRYGHYPRATSDFPLSLQDHYHLSQLQAGVPGHTDVVLGLSVPSLLGGAFGAAHEIAHYSISPVFGTWDSSDARECGRAGAYDLRFKAFGEHFYAIEGKQWISQGD